MALRRGTLRAADPAHRVASAQCLPQPLPLLSCPPASQAVTHYNDPAIIAEVSSDLGEPMVRKLRPGGPGLAGGQAGGAGQQAGEWAGGRAHPGGRRLQLPSPALHRGAIGLPPIARAISQSAQLQKGRCQRQASSVSAEPG